MIPLSKYIIAMELFDNALTAGGAWRGVEQVSGWLAILMMTLMTRMIQSLQPSLIEIKLFDSSGHWLLETRHVNNV